MNLRDVAKGTLALTDYLFGWKSTEDSGDERAITLQQVKDIVGVVPLQVTLANIATNAIPVTGPALAETSDNELVFLRTGGVAVDVGSGVDWQLVSAANDGVLEKVVEFTPANPSSSQTNPGAAITTTLNPFSTPYVTASGFKLKSTSVQVNTRSEWDAVNHKFVVSETGSYEFVLPEFITYTAAAPQAFAVSAIINNVGSYVIDSGTTANGYTGKTKQYMGRFRLYLTAGEEVFIAITAGSDLRPNGTLVVGGLNSSIHSNVTSFDITALNPRVLIYKVLQ